MSELERHDVPATVEPNEWTLSVGGAVNRPLELSEGDLASFPSETFSDDFSCAEGWTAEGLRWRGVRGETLLERANPSARSRYALVRAMDGDYACSFRLDRFADAILAVGLDGDHLPVEHGGPARLVPTDSGRDCWESVKWVSEIEVAESRPTEADTAEEIALGRIE